MDITQDPGALVQRVAGDRRQFRADFHGEVQVSLMTGAVPSGTR